MKKLVRISGIALCVCLALTLLSFLFPQGPKIHRFSTTGTENEMLVEGSVLYERGFLIGVADYSISTSGNQYSSSQVLESIKSGKTTPTPTTWSVEWGELSGNFIAACFVVGLVLWWWNQEEPHKLEQPVDTEQEIVPNP